jgi:hypothetical protein
VPVSATCATGPGGRLTLSGSAVPSAGTADLRVDLRDFDLKQIQNFLSAFARLEIRRGTVSATGRLQWNGTGHGGPMLRFRGDVASTRFSSVDPKIRERFLSWEDLRLRDLEFDQGPPRIVIREIAATSPYIRFVVAPDLTTSLQAIAVPPDSVPAAFRPRPDQPDTIPVGVHLVRVKDGSMNYADFSLTPNFATGVYGLNGTIQDLSSARAAHALIDLTGKVDEQAPVTFSGTINPLNSRGITDVSAKFQNIELTTFTPYSGKFMGYAIARGKLDLALHYFIQDLKLKAENQILIRQLSLGRKVDSPDATSLPVKFAIALLKDKNGDIDLNLPIHGDLNDPKFSVVPIVMKVLVNLITKAVTSPFKLFGAIFGGDKEEAAPAIHFPYGSASIDTTEVKKLDAVERGLADRPGLKLEIEPSGQHERDSLVVAEERFRRLLLRSTAAPRHGETPGRSMIAGAALRPTAGLPAAEYTQALMNVYIARFGKIPALGKVPGKRSRDPSADPELMAAEGRRLESMEERVRSSVAVPSTEVAGLAVARARAVQRYLLRDSTVTAERIYLVAPKGTYPPDSTGVEVGLSLTD